MMAKETRTHHRALLSGLQRSRTSSALSLNLQMACKGLNKPWALMRMTAKGCSWENRKLLSKKVNSLFSIIKATTLQELLKTSWVQMLAKRNKSKYMETWSVRVLERRLKAEYYRRANKALLQEGLIMRWRNEDQSFWIQLVGLQIVLSQRTLANQPSMLMERATSTRLLVESTTAIIC